MNLSSNVELGFAEETSPVGLFTEKTASSEATSKLFTQGSKVGSDSWIDDFVQQSEVRLRSQPIDNASSASVVQEEPIFQQDLVFQRALVSSDSIDPLTGAPVELDAVSSVPNYPGYTLSYTPGRALEDRSAVAQWQAQMQQRGWVIDVDGLFGPQSDRIARQFQQEKGLSVDGIIGPETWQAAFDNSTITPGDAAQPEDTPDAIAPPSLVQPNDNEFSGTLISYSPFSDLRYSADVQTFQQRLQELGWRIDADGLFGPSSAGVTRAFQRQVGLDTDGIVGALTWAAVFSENAPMAPVEQAITPPSGIRPISETGLDLIRDFEGRRLNAYQDAVGVWTIGYGHTRTAYPGQRITEAGATALLREDVATFERAVSRAVRVPLTDNQYAALVSFAFNVGSGALNSSTLLRRLNAGDYFGAANELRRWNRAGGRELYGLTRRREAERSLFLS